MTATDAIESKPTVTFSTLAKVMGPMSPSALVRLLRGHKERKAGPRRSYQNARRQAIELLADHVPLDPGAALPTHEREAVTAMERARLRAPEWVRAVRPSSVTQAWELEGVSISMNPDVELEGFSTSGAAKVIFTKEPLAQGVGAAMAALLWHYRKNVLGIDTTQPDSCIVYEPRLPWLHLPGPRPERQVKSAELACRIISALWPVL